MANEEGSRRHKRTLRSETPEDIPAPIDSDREEHRDPSVGSPSIVPIGSGEKSSHPGLQWTSPKRKADSKKSYVWKYFIDGGLNDNGQQLKRCTLCSTAYAFCSSTTNMKNHLTDQHDIKGPGIATQQTTDEVLENTTTPHSTQKMGELNDALLTFIVDDLQPFHLLKSNAFKEFCSKLDPRFRVRQELASPARRQVREIPTTTPPRYFCHWGNHDRPLDV
jgi:hypothetical protein